MRDIRVHIARKGGYIVPLHFECVLLLFNCILLSSTKSMLEENFVVCLITGYGLWGLVGVHEKLAPKVLTKQQQHELHD